jgi:hypothetical protein
MDSWQEYLVAVALLAAGGYLIHRLRRAGKRGAPPTCASCERCPSAARESCDANIVQLQDHPNTCPGNKHSAP